MHEISDDIRIIDKELPFEFLADSVGGSVEVKVFEVPEEDYPEDHPVVRKPFMYSVHTLNLLGNLSGRSTVGDVREEILAFQPNDDEARIRTEGPFIEEGTGYD